MAPPAADVDIQPEAPVFAVPTKGAQGSTTASRLSGPLTYSGSLDSYDHFDVTNVIGREFPKLQLSEILRDDTKLRDLAILGTQAEGPKTKTSLKLTPSQSPSAASSSSATKT